MINHDHEAWILEYITVASATPLNFEFCFFVASFYWKPSTIKFWILSFDTGMGDYGSPVLVIYDFGYLEDVWLIWQPTSIKVWISKFASSTLELFY